MKKLGKILAWGLVVLAVALALAITFTIGWRPFIGPNARATTDHKFQTTAERLARGKYLARQVSGCMDCHTPHDWSKAENPWAGGSEGAGQVMPFTDLPGKIVASNLTPDPQTGAGSWTDDQIARAIREGVGHDGRALFNMMPYQHYRRMSDEDLASIVVYLRSLPPVRNPLPATEMIFPVKYLIRAVPQPVTEPVSAPDSSTPLKRGDYLVNTLSPCSDCHTPIDNHGQPIPGLEFAGGFILQTGSQRSASSNITSDASGIPYYDEKMFLDVIHNGSVRARALSTMMPWPIFRGMTDDDLTSIFAYVKTLKPVRHHVDNTEPPTYCKLCRNMHGGGNQN